MHLEGPYTGALRSGEVLRPSNYHCNHPHHYPHHQWHTIISPICDIYFPVAPQQNLITGICVLAVYWGWGPQQAGLLPGLLVGRQKEEAEEAVHA